MVRRKAAHVEPMTEPLTGEAFGELLLAQHADLREPQYELVERYDGFLGVIDARAYFRPSDQLDPLEAQACQESVAPGRPRCGRRSPGPAGWVRGTRCCSPGSDDRPVHQHRPGPPRLPPAEPRPGASQWPATDPRPVPESGHRVVRLLVPHGG